MEARFLCQSALTLPSEVSMLLSERINGSYQHRTSTQMCFISPEPAGSPPYTWIRHRFTSKLSPPRQYAWETVNYISFLRWELGPSTIPLQPLREAPTPLEGPVLNPASVRHRLFFPPNIKFTSLRKWREEPDSSWEFYMFEFKTLSKSCWLVHMLKKFYYVTGHPPKP